MVTDAPASSRYRIVTTFTTWASAEAACEGEGTHLVVLGSSQERDAVLAQVTTEEIWAGASDARAEGTWRDVTGGTTSFFDWDTANGEPSTSSADDCLLVRGTGSNGTIHKMDAKPCQSQTLHYYVCECDGLAADPNAY